MIQLDRYEDVFVARMDDGENRMNQLWLDAITQVLDHIDGLDGARALVTTGTGRFYSNGLDLDWMEANGIDRPTWVTGVEAVFARILGAPYITVAACNGHAFAAGAMLAMAHDFRVIREDRGFFCLPEVDIGIPLTTGMNALMTSKLPRVTAHEVLVTGKRFGGTEAAAKEIATEALPESLVLPRAIELATGLAEKAGPTIATIKSRLYAEPIALLRNTVGTAPAP